MYVCIRNMNFSYKCLYTCIHPSICVYIRTCLCKCWQKKAVEYEIKWKETRWNFKSGPEGHPPGYLCGTVGNWSIEWPVGVNSDDPWVNGWAAEIEMERLILRRRSKGLSTGPGLGSERGSKVLNRLIILGRGRSRMRRRKKRTKKQRKWLKKRKGGGGGSWVWELHGINEKKGKDERSRKEKGEKTKWLRKRE